MFKISNRSAFLLSVPTLLPFLLLCFDFLAPNEEVKTIVMDKSSLHGHHIVFKGASSSVPASTYEAFQTGDSVTLKVSPIFNTVTEISQRNTHEYIEGFLVTIFLSLPLLLFLGYLITKRGFNFSESRSYPIYCLSISVTYLSIFLFSLIKIQTLLNVSH